MGSRRQLSLSHPILGTATLPPFNPSTSSRKQRTTDTRTHFQRREIEPFPRGLALPSLSSPPPTLKPKLPRYQVQPSEFYLPRPRTWTSVGELKKPGARAQGDRDFGIFCTDRKQGVDPPCPLRHSSPSTGVLLEYGGQEQKGRLCGQDASLPLTYNPDFCS